MSAGVCGDEKIKTRFYSGQSVSNMERRAWFEALTICKVESVGSTRVSGRSKIVLTRHRPPSKAIKGESNSDIAATLFSMDARRERFHLGWL